VFERKGEIVLVDMEVPRYWREMKTNTSFTGREVGTYGVEPAYFKYPGGKIALQGTYEEIYSRFESKGFEPEIIEKVLFNLFGAVASEAAVSFEKIVNSQDELVGSEVRKESGSEEKFGVDRLPGKIARKTLFSSRANN